MCKEHTLTRTTNVLSRNHPKLSLLFLSAVCANSLVTDAFHVSICQAYNH